MNAVNELIPTRESLLSRLSDWNDQKSWKTFFDTYWKLIYNTAIKAGLTDAEAQDVVQETIICICKNMKDFRYDKRGSFKGWLLRLTSWRWQISSGNASNVLAIKGMNHAIPPRQTCWIALRTPFHHRLKAPGTRNGRKIWWRLLSNALSGKLTGKPIRFLIFTSSKNGRFREFPRPED